MNFVVALVEWVGKYKKMKVGVAKIKVHVAKTNVDVRETNWETVQLLCWNWSYWPYCVIHLFILFFLSLSLKLYSFQFVSRTSTLVLATWTLILATPTFIFLYLPTHSTRATTKFNIQSLFHVVECRVIRRAYICSSFCFDLHSAFLEYSLPF